MGSKFAGGDPDYLRTAQYGTADKLAARQQLHTRYSTAPVRWFEWMTATIPWRPGIVVEVGCGPGHFWEEGRPAIEGPLVLTDLSEGMVDTAVTRARRQGYRVEGLVAPGQSLPVADGVAAHVISNHMLYHVPRPADAVAEMVRVVTDTGLVSVATNGRGHMAELKRINHAVFNNAVFNNAVFGTTAVDATVDAFGLESGRPILEGAFEEVELLRYDDDLRTTDARHVVEYLTSYPPGEDATEEQHAEIEALVVAEFEAGSGVFTVSKDVGLFLCRGPRRR